MSYSYYINVYRMRERDAVSVAFGVNKSFKEKVVSNTISIRKKVGRCFSNCE